MATPKPNDRKDPAQNLEQFLELLSPAAQVMILHRPQPPRPPRPRFEADSDYQSFLDRLSPVARATLLAGEIADGEAVPVPPVPLEFPADSKLFYFLDEAPDGEVPIRRKFKSEQSLAAHLQKLIGTDVHGHVSFGINVPIAVDPHGGYYLLLPDEAVLQVSPVVRVIEDSRGLDLTVLPDGFLGPPELAEIVTSVEEREKRQASVRKKPDAGGDQDADRVTK